MPMDVVRARRMRIPSPQDTERCRTVTFRSVSIGVASAPVCVFCVVRVLYCVRVGTVGMGMGTVTCMGMGTVWAWVWVWV